MSIRSSPRRLRAARNLVHDSFAVRSGEGVLITADTRTDTALLDALTAAVIDAGGQPIVAISPLLPYQGGLSDPFVPDTLRAAMAAADVWLDLCFPYHAGSSGHSAAMEAQRCRYGLIATSCAEYERQIRAKGAGEACRLAGGIANELGQRDVEVHQGGEVDTAIQALE